MINDYEEELKKSLNNFYYDKKGILKSKMPKKSIQDSISAAGSNEA